MNLPILQIENYNVYSIDQQQQLLHDVFLHIDENQFYVMVGQNGAGKSTLLSVIQNEVQKYVIEGHRDTKINFIPLLSQQIEHYFIGQTAWEELVLSYESSHGDADVTQEDMNQAIQKVVNELDITKLLHQPIYQLSGGQQQLVALASVLLSNSPLILIDEMTTMLDCENRASILKKIRAVQSRVGCSIIYVTHDEQEIISSDQVIAISDHTVRQLTHTEWISKYSEANRNQKQWQDNRLPALREHAESEYETKTKTTIVASSLVLDYTNQFENKTYTFKQGTLNVIEGKNGAGKSTLIKAIAGDIKLVRGKIHFLSESDSLTTKKAMNTVSSDISYCPQFLQHYWSKDNVLEECNFVLKCCNMYNSFKDNKERELYIQSYLHYFGFEQHHLSTSIYSLSVGLQRKLALALCFMVNRKWVLLDEPYAYLDTEAKEKLTRLIEQRIKAGYGVILISHEKIERTEIDINTIEINQAPLNKSDAEVSKLSLTHPLHHKKLNPLMLIAVLLISSIIIFIHANMYELCMLFVILFLIQIITGKKELRQLIKMIGFLVLYMSVVGAVIALDFNTWEIDTTRLLSYLLYTLRLIVLLMLTFPMMYLISPFRLMRALQQMTSNSTKINGEYLYSIVILFKFVALLQRLWMTLSLLYSTKYKKKFANVLISFLVQFVRESLLIAESIVLNYELRRPLNSNVLLYRVGLKRIDYVVASAVFMICLATIIV